MNPSLDSAARNTRSCDFEQPADAFSKGRKGDAWMGPKPGPATGQEKEEGTGHAAPPPRDALLSRALMQEWLAWQCRMISGVIAGILYLPGRALSVATVWPDAAKTSPRFAEFAQRALTERSGLILPRQQCGENCDLLAYPLLVGGKPVAVMVVAISMRPEPQQRAILQLMQWGGIWMESMIRQQIASDQAHFEVIFELAAATLEPEPLHAIAMKITNLLAERLGCERASIGLRHGMQIRVEAMCRIARFDPRSQLVRAIEAAMEEAVDQGSIQLQPPVTDARPLLNRAHLQLAGQHGQHNICTIPLPGTERAIGAITLERPAGEPFDHGSIILCNKAAGLIGPALELKQREAQPLPVKAWAALGRWVVQLFGPHHLKLKLSLLAGAGILALLSTLQGTYRISAPATLEGKIQQAVVAPQEGYILSAEVRAGDRVRQGDPMATLDDRELELQRQKWQSEREKLSKEYHQALAKRDRTALSILRARIDQAEAELRLVEGQIERTRLLAPIDGLVVSGDLSQSLGAPVKTGDLLFQVAPLDSYRVALRVDEGGIRDVTAGLQGKLVLAALPETPLEITVEEITPVAVAGDGSNYFRVDASLDTPLPAVRPGMQGVAKLDRGQRSLLWIWTHHLVDRLRLWAWSLGI